MSDNNLNEFKMRFENNNLTDKALANLMTEMERAFGIPMLNDENYNFENQEVIKLYRQISDARKFD